MRFRVPQFIDIEDKIFGPFTFRQFIYLLGSGGLCFVLFRALPLLIALPLMLPVAGLGLALSFYKPNGKPFLSMIEAGFNYYIGSKLYIWKKNIKKARVDKVLTPQTVAPEPVTKKLSESKLKDIAWSLDVLDMKNRGDGK